MIFLRLSDGLGNQMFQYAYARYLQEKYKEVVWLNLEFYKDNKDRAYALNHFRLNPNVYVQKGLEAKIYYKYMQRLVKKCYENKLFSKCTEQEERIKKDMFVKKYGIHFTMPDTFMHYKFSMTKRKTKIVIGHFQSGKYFEEIKEIILKEFQLKEALPDDVKEMVKILGQENSVCMHVRRGDYLQKKWQALNICKEDYYLQAMDVIAENVENPVFYIFSNTEEDLKWIERNYHFKYPVKYVNMNNPDYIELKLMSSCKHFIISNSTFSWWAQYLAMNKDKVVVAPDKWCKNMKNKVEDIYMDTWKVIEV